MSMNQPAPKDEVWFSNLQLLGYTGADFKPSTFDHSNPGAFQQAFHFLFGLIDAEKFKSEMRDCWPVLDKKQESEFRRKLVGMIKDLQKDYPNELPILNPSLFQSPGGRKFLCFLKSFSTLVLKILSGATLARPKSKGLSQQLQFGITDRFIKSQRSLVQDAFSNQSELVTAEVKSKETVDFFSREFSNRKQSLEEKKIKLKESMEEVKALFPSLVTSDGFVDKDKLEESLEIETVSGRELEAHANALAANHKETWACLDKSIDLNRVRDELDLTTLLTVDLSTTYKNLLQGSLSTVDRVLEMNFPVKPPIDEFESLENKLLQQLKVLENFNSEVDTDLETLKTNRNALLAKSLSIDWENCALAPKTSPKESSPEPLLHPPSPSLIDALTREGSSITPSRIQLSSPDIEPRKELAKTEAKDNAPDCPDKTPVSGVLQRRFPRRISQSEVSVSEHSPILRQSLTHSSSGNKGNTVCQEAVARLASSSEVEESFCPALSSTIYSLPGIEPEQQRPIPMASEFLSPPQCKRVNKESHVTETTSKIEGYKKVLMGLKGGKTPFPPSGPSNAQSASPTFTSIVTPLTTRTNTNRPSLAETWARVRKSLSPLAPKTPYFHLTLSDSPEKNDVSPGGETGGVNGMVITRLDELMASPSVDSSGLLDTSEPDLTVADYCLSPHCP